MRTPRPELALERILAALEAGLIAASDDELMDAARELGMNPAMKGSAAFADIHVRLGPWQSRADPSPGQAPGKNGTPIARLLPKRDAPPSR